MAASRLSFGIIVVAVVMACATALANGPRARPEIRTSGAARLTRPGRPLSTTNGRGVPRARNGFGSAVRAMRAGGFMSSTIAWRDLRLSRLDERRFALALRAVRSTFEAHRQNPNVQIDEYWLEMNRRSGIPSTGLCAAAAEAVYHLLGRTELVPHVYKEVNPATGVEESHWWIVHRPDGPRSARQLRLDPSRDQYGAEVPHYERGRGTGFQQPTRGPSRRAQILLHDAIAYLRAHGFEGPTPTNGVNESWGWLTRERAARRLE